MTQPSVSRHIQTLEQHFETPLLIRSGRQLALTAAVEALVPLGRRMVDLTLSIDEVMSSLKGEVHGHLIVACSATVGKCVLPFLLASFLQRYPKAQATCQVTARHLAVQELCDRRAHLALGSRSGFPRDEGFRRFLEDPLLLITPPDHPRACAGSITPDELKGEKFILREPTSGKFAAVNRGLMAAGVSLSELEFILSPGDSEAIALAMKEGVGAGYVSQCVVSRLVRDNVGVVRIEGVTMRQDVRIGRHTRQPATVAQTAFWEIVSDPRSPIADELVGLGFPEPLAALGSELSF